MDIGQRVTDHKALLRNAHCQELDLALGKCLNVDGRRESENAPHLLRSGALGIDEHGKTEAFLKKVSLVAVNRISYSRDRRKIAGPLADHTAQKILLIRVSDRDQNVGGFNTRLLERSVACAVADHSHSVHAVRNGAELVRVVVNDCDIIPLVAELLCYCRAYFAAPYDNNVHKLPPKENEDALKKALS